MSSNTKEYNQVYYLNNKEKVLWKNNQWNKNNRERVMEAYRELEYGITSDEYKARLKIQKDRCAICYKKETIKRNGKIQSLSVDHDHKSKKVRDLLCYRCNSALGSFRESIEILEKAIQYLRRHNGLVSKSGVQAT